MYESNIANVTLMTARHEFITNGFCVIHDFLSAAELAELEEEVGRYIANVVPSLPAADAIYAVPGDPKTLRQFYLRNGLSSALGSFLWQPKWVNLARHLLADEVVPQVLEWFNKPPARSGETPPHQDGYYFRLNPTQALTMWLPLDHADECNGCMRYIPTSHILGLRPHSESGVSGFSRGISDYTAHDREAEKAVPVKPGDLLVHHALTIHCAHENKSTRHRRSLGLVYFAASARNHAEPWLS